MLDTVLSFIKRHSSMILTTHANPDPDGLGAERVFALIARSMGKPARIVNADPVPEKLAFMDPEHSVEVFETVRPTLPKDAALVILDTADEYNIGALREIIPPAAEVFVIDHHEPNKFSSLAGFIDNTASSACELMVELAEAAGIPLTPSCAAAAYAGIAYDTGFFAYPKTTRRTFRAALSLVENGAAPNEIYRTLNENDSPASLLLLKKVISTLKIHNRGRVAALTLRKDDLESTGAHIEDSENFINIPMKNREIEVSVLLKENREGNLRCSLRSRGGINVAKIAQSLGGGGHVTAAGFKSSRNPEETLDMVLRKITEELDTQ